MSKRRLYYLREALQIPAEKEELYLEAMAKYQYEWWHSDDCAELVIYQLQEKVLLVRLWLLQEALEKVLGRAVHEEEMQFANERLKVEVRQALNLTEEQFKSYPILN